VSGSGEASAGTQLRGAIGRGGFFTLAFGAVVGSGWVVVLGEWLKAAGPLGVVLGFAAGGVAMILIALCYGELASRFAHAGGEFLYTLHTLGPFLGFLVGWFLTLYSVAVCVFEAVALAWMVRTLLPGIALGDAYHIAGGPVSWDALLIGIVATLGLGALHYHGAKSAIRFQNAVTSSFIAAIIVLILCGLWWGNAANLKPWVAAAPAHWVGGAIWVFSTCAFFLNGWQASLHAIEERRTSLSAAGAVACMVAGIAAAAVFYTAIVLSASMALPWRTLIGRDLPAAAAFGALGFGGLLGTLVLIAAIVSLTKTWSAMIWMSSRVLFAQARHGMLPRYMAEVDPKSGVPRKAILFVTLLSLAGLALGRSAILPIVNMVSICLALSIILCLIVLLRRRRRAANELPPFTVPGGTPTILIALVCATLMVGVALIEPIVEGGGRIPPEWILLGLWAAVGVAVWLTTRNLRKPNAPQAARPA